MLALHILYYNKYNAYTNTNKNQNNTNFIMQGYM